MQACSKAKEHSKINKDPQDFIEIHGSKPANLGLRFDIEYTALDTACLSRTFGV
jgi:hypothetical protein